MALRYRSQSGLRFYRTPEGSGIKGYSLKRRKFDMHSHSFQDTELKLFTQVNDFQEQVMEELTILRYPRGFENKRLNYSKNVNSERIHTVFKI